MPPTKSTDAGPTLIEWRLPSGFVLRSIVGRSCDAPEFAKKATERAVLKPFVPYGATGWRLTGETEWKPLAALPARYGLPRRASDTLPAAVDDEAEVGVSDRSSVISNQ